MALPTTVHLGGDSPDAEIRALHVTPEGRYGICLDVHYADSYVPDYALDGASANEAAAYILGLAAHYSHLDRRRDALVDLARELRNRK